MTPVVLIYPTGESSQVYWYASTDQALYGDEMASATRLGAEVHTAPVEVALAAFWAHEQLQADPGVDLTELATHRRVSGPGLEDGLVELQRPRGEIVGDAFLPRYVRRLMASIEVVQDQCARAVLAEQRALELKHNHWLIAQRLRGALAVAFADRDAERNARRRLAGLLIAMNRGEIRPHPALERELVRQRDAEHAVPSAGLGHLGGAS